VGNGPERELIAVRVADAHRSASSGTDRLRGCDTSGQDGQHSIADGSTPSGTSTCIQVGRAIRASKSVPSVVGGSADLEGGLRGAELFVAAVTDNEPWRDRPMGEGPGVTVCGRNHRRFAATSSLESAIAPASIGTTIDRAQPPAVTVVVDRRALRVPALFRHGDHGTGL